VPILEAATAQVAIARPIHKERFSIEDAALADESDQTRYRGWSIPCAGTQVYAPRYREEWLHKIEHAGVRRRAELLYQQLDGLQALRRTLRPELLAENRKHKASKLLRQIPCIGPIRATRLIALM
jgi:transposase